MTDHCFFTDSRKKERLRCKLSLFISIIFLLSACAPAKNPALEQLKINTLNQAAGKSTYRIAPGDNLSIKHYYNKDLNENVVVRPDGKISLQLIDEVDAAGLSIVQLDEVLTRAYADVLKTSSKSYQLAVGDQILIKSFYFKRLNDTVRIRPDGKIALQLIDEVQASGLTPSQLDKLLTEKYSAFLDSPDISINVLTFNRPDLSVMINHFSGQKFFVGGEVKQPGLISTEGRIRLLDAIIQAAGALKSGDLSKVILIRRGHDDKPEIYAVNVNNILQGVTSDISLKPYDIVYIPKTNIANMAHYVKTYIWDLLPNQVAFSFLYNWNNEVQVK